jgi:hypothetical protein
VRILAITGKLQYTPGPDFPTMFNKISQERTAGLPSSTDINLMAASHTAEGLKPGCLAKGQIKVKQLFARKSRLKERGKSRRKE